MDIYVKFSLITMFSLFSCFQDQGLVRMEYDYSSHLS